METHSLDCVGLKCPQPILKIATKVPEMQAGDVLEVIADCETFKSDIQQWCERTNKNLLFCNDEGNKSRAQIQF